MIALPSNLSQLLRVSIASAGATAFVDAKNLESSGKPGLSFFAP